MKEKDAFSNPDKHPLVVYVEKPDGSYDALKTGTYMLDNFLDDYQTKRGAVELEARKKMDAGELSPLGMFLAAREMTIEDVAARAGVSRATLRRHCLPRHFEKATVAQLRAYADVLGIPVAAFLNPAFGLRFEARA